MGTTVLVVAGLMIAYTLGYVTRALLERGQRAVSVHSLDAAYQRGMTDGRATGKAELVDELERMWSREARA